MKKTLSIGGASLVLDVAGSPSATAASSPAAKKTTQPPNADDRLEAFAELRALLATDGFDVRRGLELVTRLRLSADHPRRGRALVHARGRGESGSRLALAGFLNRHEDALKARAGGSVLTRDALALPTVFGTRVPRIGARTYRTSPTRKPGSHKGR
ncbi:MAG: hypothetical protein RLN76_13565 [Phycisphaeraceae bacterium]